MENALQAFFSWQFILFALMIYGIVYGIRIVIEYYFKKFSLTHFYNEVFLPLSPMITGLVLALFATGYAYPAGLSSFSGREMFGFVAGLTSTTIYRVLNSILNKNSGNNQDQPSKNITDGS